MELNIVEFQDESILGDVRKYSIYVTYRLYNENTSEVIHCNYIERLDTDRIYNAWVKIGFDPNSFPYFENGAVNANKFSLLVNIVENELVGDEYVLRPHKSNEWREYGPYDVEDFEDIQEGKSVLLNDNYKIYNLDYINYPKRGEDKLSFGDEIFFFGNVDTDAEAIIHSTDLALTLPLNGFNSTTNNTWDGESSVYISEIGIYDDDNNLVAIAKLSEPIEKNSKITRTFVFSLDF